MSSDFKHGDRVELTNDPFIVPLGTAGTVTHLNGDEEPGTESHWTAWGYGDGAVWVEWDHPKGEIGQATWTPKDDISKL